MAKDNVQLSWEAEPRRNKTVSEAKARKNAKVKQAKADAEETVSKFRDEKDQEYENFKSGQGKDASNDNSKSVVETDAQIVKMKSIASARLDKVADLCVQLVCSVDTK
eukprot:GDKJ01004819.1.p1 GENE.GDKJ01004819.1~~GDKJ01004819.1.p1  ORF type:complete len:108 (+),score=13.63 GDKJ01004819.1:70-393(+)